jgi:ENTH domain
MSSTKCKSTQLHAYLMPGDNERKEGANVVCYRRNVVLNYTEMEAKVHEATNNEPWGASSTLMQEIAQGTFN